MSALSTARSAVSRLHLGHMMCHHWPQQLSASPLGTCTSGGGPDTPVLGQLAVAWPLVTGALLARGELRSEAQRCSSWPKLSQSQDALVQLVELASSLTVGCCQSTGVLLQLWPAQWLRGDLLTRLGSSSTVLTPIFCPIHVCSKVLSISLCCRLSHSGRHPQKTPVDCCDLSACCDICKEMHRVWLS